MVKLEHISTHLVIGINELLKNQRLLKLISHDVRDPLAQPDVARSTVFPGRIQPFPFVPEATIEDGSWVRIYYARGDISDVVVEDTTINFDVLVSHNLWLCSDESKGDNLIASYLRPHRIMYEIVNTLNKSMTIEVAPNMYTSVKFEFGGFRHIYANDKVQGVQVSARLVNLSKLR